MSNLAEGHILNGQKASLKKDVFFYCGAKRIWTSDFYTICIRENNLCWLITKNI
jgi:hypothetical protein